MHILVTNDDGVYAPGLLALVEELRKVGKVTVVAPDRNWSASGHVKTLSRPLRVKNAILADGSPAMACDGAPSDCVALSCMGLLEEPVEMIVSGINPNANLGHDVTYSGTVTAAMEAAIWNLPGIAVSMDAPEHHQGVLDYETAAKVGANVAKMVWKKKIPKNILLNVNVPYCSMEKLNGYRITRQGLRVYHDQLIKREDPQGRPYYWIGGEAPTGVPNEGTDIGALSQRYVSITPLSLDLTAYDFKEILSEWKFD
ncbi:MAG: 5'/3'-nucleotidase SurE [Pelolinea sp.]|nr:5'/3'-nucleotidase SurE [Pelolinea sp.]